MNRTLSAKGSAVSANTVLTPTPTGDRQTFVPLKNEPGVQTTISKTQLYIDSQYQRKINEKQVARMVGNWNWISCGVLEVTKRPGNTLYFVIDGQHRLRAASYLTKVKELPCIVFELDTIKDEAISFLAANTERRMPTISDQFKALLIAEDPIATKMVKLAGEYSRTIGIPTDGNHISCVSAFAAMLRLNTSAMERVFPVVAHLAAGHPMPAKLLWGFHYLERSMPKRESLADDRWHNRIQRIGYLEVTEEIRRYSMLDAKGGARTYATALLRTINKGLRQPLMANVDLVRR